MIILSKIGVVGDTGMVGQELCRILENHNRIQIVYKKNSTRQIGNLNECELVFLATKDMESMIAAKEAYNLDIKVIDMSGAFRLSKSNFESWYKMEHQCPELLDEAVYGMPALGIQKIAKAKIVGNPGCYPTSVILPLYPLKGLVQGEATIVSTSGNSGARKTAEEMDNDISYSYGSKHKHAPEMERYTEVKVNFTPIVLRSVFKGINTNIRIALSDELAKLPDSEAVEILENAIKKAYVEEDLIFILRDTNGIINGTSLVNDSHCAVIKINVEDGFAYINSLIDNLGKGAASQGVENMNIMLGFPRLYGIEPAYSTKLLNL